jgi:LemA protein
MKNPIVITLLGIVAVVILIAGWFVSIGNNMVGLDEGVKTSWSQVENVYQRRADLIPNLVNTVKGYAKHEAGVLESVIKARASATQVRVNNPGDIAKFEQSQGELTQALSRLLMVTERYPDLKADKNFLELQSQLEGTENRIAVERKRFNETSQEYNTYIRKFPNSIVAGMKGFAQKPYFAAAAGAATAPKVEF